MPTFLDLTGAKYPENHKEVAITPYAGESLADVLRNKAVSRKKPIFWKWKNIFRTQIFLWTVSIALIAGKSTKNLILSHVRC